MGHIQYYMNYNNLSYLFRNGANPGFHEGIADILSLAVGTASYYQRLGLLDEDVDIGKKHALKKYDSFAHKYWLLFLGEAEHFKSNSQS